MDRPGYDVFETSWGWIGTVGTDKGIWCCSLPEETPQKAVEHLTSTARRGLPEHTPGAFDGFRAQLDEYFRGERTQWDVALDLADATDFSRRAWDACRSIPPGQTRTYRWLAEQTGRPNAPRAAGQAMARNRVPIVIPCHRVIGSDGGLHGFAGPGLPLKARLLELERRCHDPAAKGQALAPGMAEH